MDTYINIVNAFWAKRRRTGLCSSDADVYFALLNEANMQHWAQPFAISNTIICAELGMSKSTFIRSRNRLQQLGYITFEAGKRNAESPRYWFHFETKTETKRGTKSETKRGTKSETIYIEKEKDIEEDIINSPISPRGDAEAKQKQTAVKAEWRTDIDTYRRELRTEVDSLLADGEWLAKMQTYYPNVDIIRTIDKAVTTYWETEAGWQNKKRKHTNAIDWRRTLTNALAQPQNKVYLITNHYERVTDKYQQSQRACAEAMLEAFGAQIQ